jgi:hypothetical protein
MRLTDGCVRFLAFLRTRIGSASSWRVLTGSIARELHRTRRTIRNYIHEAEPAGYLESEYDKRTGITTLRLTEQMAPPPRTPPATASSEHTPWPREPTPAFWWHKAALSALRKGGGKKGAAINSSTREKEKRRPTNNGGATAPAT